MKKMKLRMCISNQVRPERVATGHHDEESPEGHHLQVRARVDLIGPEEGSGQGCVRRSLGWLWACTRLRQLVEE